MTSPEKFNAGIGNWTAIQSEPWNRLRYVVYHANLNRHAPDRPLNILDVGGGSGMDAIPLAQQGHQVTLVDYSDAMLEEARKFALSSGVQDKIVFEQADILSLPTLFPESQFDLVICHNVLQYVEDEAAAVRAICVSVKPGGLISLISVNRYSDVLQAALLFLDLDDALNKIDNREYFTPVFDTTVQRFDGAEIAGLLEDAGCAVLGHYGIRCVMDYISDNDIKSNPDFYAKLEQLELALSDKYPYYLTARFFQLIARKPL